MKTLRAKPETQPLPVLMLTAMTDEPSTRAGFESRSAMAMIAFIGVRISPSAESVITRDQPNRRPKS
jgi:hypothetical protein